MTAYDSCHCCCGYVAGKGEDNAASDAAVTTGDATPTPHDTPKAGAATSENGNAVRARTTPKATKRATTSARNN
jgi:hypothetical protein